MPVADLREWIEREDALGELTRVDGADTDSEIGWVTDVYQFSGPVRVGRYTAKKTPFIKKRVSHVEPETVAELREAKR